MLGWARGQRAAARKKLGNFATWKSAHLERYHLGEYSWEVSTWENILGKLPIRKIALGKCLTLIIMIA